MVVLTRFQVNNNLLQTSVVRCAIWYHLHKLKSVKNTHGEVLKSNIPPWVFFRFSKLYKWYEIAQNITCKSTNVIKKVGKLAWIFISRKRRKCHSSVRSRKLTQFQANAIFSEGNFTFDESTHEALSSTNWLCLWFQFLFYSAQNGQKWLQIYWGNPY